MECYLDLVTIIIIIHTRPQPLNNLLVHVCTTKVNGHVHTHNTSMEGTRKLNSAALEMPFPMTPFFFFAEIKFSDFGRKP